MSNAPFSRPWLLDLASIQEVDGADESPSYYDDARQMTYVGESAGELAIDSDAGIGTKKADRETGEDQKGF